MSCYTRHLWDKAHGLKHLLNTNIKNKDILVIGSALSGMDVIVSLYEKIKTGNYNGQIYLLSRHGLLHSPIIEGNEGVFLDQKTVTKVSQMTVKEKIHTLEKIFADCKENPDLVSFSQDGYQLANHLLEILLGDDPLSEEIRSYVVELYLKNHFTDVFATGMPEPTTRKIGELIKKNQLVIRTGSIQSVLPKKQYLEVNLHPTTKENKYEPPEAITASHIINATGDVGIESKLDKIFIDQTNLFVIREFDSSGHFIKSISADTFLESVFYVGPQRATSSTTHYGNTRSTARSIIELRLQAHEVAGHLLYGLQLLQAKPSLLRRRSSSNPTSTTLVLDSKYLSSYQQHESLTTEVKKNRCDDDFASGGPSFPTACRKTCGVPIRLTASPMANRQACAVRRSATSGLISRPASLAARTTVSRFSWLTSTSTTPRALGGQAQRAGSAETAGSEHQRGPSVEREPVLHGPILNVVVLVL